MNKNEINQRIAEMLLKSRYKSGYSQEYVAKRLGLSTRTVQNWENAKSMPDVAQLYDWFNAIQVPPHPFILAILYPDVDSQKFDDEGEMDKALLDMAKDLPYHEKQKLLFILEGTHGSSPVSVIDMMVANLQTPLRDRMGVCQTIISNYEIAESLDMLTDKEAVRPSVNHLKEVLQRAIIAVRKRQNSYLR